MYLNVEGIEDYDEAGGDKADILAKLKADSNHPTSYTQIYLSITKLRC